MKNYWAQDKAGEMEVRLRRIGATQSEITQFLDAWVNDDTWEQSDRERWWALGDPHLRREILAQRDESFTDDEHDAIGRAREIVEGVKDLEEQAASVAILTVAQVLDWVGEDGARARASLAWEQQCAMPRKTLIRALRNFIATLER